MIDRMDIWFSGVDRTAQEIEKIEALLSPEEVIRAQRFRFLRDRNRYIVHHGVLRLLLASYVGCESRQVDIRTSSDGKPYLAGCAGAAAIHFSISRSDAVAASAFSRIGSIGIDIEKIRDIPERIEIAERHFTPHERSEIFSVPKSQRSVVFTRLWARKEAVLKAQGQGLLKPLDCVDVSTQGKAPWKVAVCGAGACEAFWVSDIAGPAGFATAVAVAVTAGEISVHYFDHFGNAGLGNRYSNTH